MLVNKVAVFNNISNVKNINFKKQNNNQENKTLETKTNKVPIEKMLPVLAAFAGLTTLSSCGEDYYKFKDMERLQKEYFEKTSNNIIGLPKTDESILLLKVKKDTLEKETADYKYKHVCIKSDKETLVFGNIYRKKDGEELSFINVYDNSNNLTSTTLKDPKTDDKFYISYEKGVFRQIHDAYGNPIQGEKEAFLLSMLLLSCFAAAGVIKNIKMPHIPHFKNDESEKNNKISE